MDDLWTTIVAPVLDAARPELVLDIGGGDERVAQLAASFVEPWGGRVQSCQRQLAGPLPGVAEVVLLHSDGQSWPVGELLEALAAASEAAGRSLPVIVVHGVGVDEELLVAVRRFAEAHAEFRMLLVPGLGGAAIVSERPRGQDAYGRLGRLLGELSLSPAAERHVAAVEDRRLAEHARAAQAWARLAVVQSLQPSAPAAPAEPSQADVRRLLNPAGLLSELGWQGAERDLGLPIPNNVLAEGRPFEWEWPITASDAPMPSIAYLLPGLPPEGSGGSHSLVQEARGLRTLGAAARVCVPVDALARAERLYGNEDGLFVAYQGQDVTVAVNGAAVVVSTEHTSVRLAERIARERPEVLCAYYVQDYEPLFAPLGSARSDHALLSYRAIPGQVLFAKTHWLRNVVMARHGVPVMKVQPSLDASLFHPRGRAEREGAVRVAAMIRPRTPRRRARATLLALEAIARRLGDGVQTFAFGCDAEAFAELRVDVARGATPGRDRDRMDSGSLGSNGAGSHLGVGDAAAVVRHLGLLTRADVAEVMRRTDVFIDASAYQAFGRTGLEAMACGAVPVLPALGGVNEYAAHDRDAVILARDSPEALADAVCELIADRERLARLREAGLRSATKFSIERAARSQLGLFAAVTTRRPQGTTVPA